MRRSLNWRLFFWFLLLSLGCGVQHSPSPGRMEKEESAKSHQAQDPTYDGKPLSYWIEQLRSYQPGGFIREDKSRGYLQAKGILRNLGPGDKAAVPLLTKALWNYSEHVS